MFNNLIPYSDIHELNLDWIIKKVREYVEKVDKLEINFDDLKSYVTNYFDNLDIQEEVNNKLDIMYENGQLANLIAEFLQFNSLFVFNNIDELKNTNNLVLNNKVLLIDRGTMYLIRNITSEDVIDDFNIIQLPNFPTLIAEIINNYSNTYIDVKSYGAVGDGETDDYDAFRMALIKAKETNRPIYAFENYYISNSIVIDYDNAELHILGTLYTNGNNPAIILTSNRCNINVHKISNITNNNNGIGIEIAKFEQDSLGVITSLNKINFTEIVGFNIGLYFKTNDNGLGIQYNTFDFSYIYCSKCIVYDCGDGSWITQNSFYNGRLSGDIGFEVVKNANMDISNCNVFQNIGFENIQTTALKMYKVHESYFRNIRMLENSTMSSYYIDMERCRANRFSGAIILPLNKINDVDTTFGTQGLVPFLAHFPNEYDCSRIESSGGGFRGTKLKTYNNKKFIIDPCEPFGYTTYGNQSHDFSDDDYTYSGMYFRGFTDSSYNITYTLPMFFANENTEFFFDCIYKTGTINIVLEDGTTILSNASITQGNYLVKKRANGWIKIPVS